jgi:ribonuclease-3
VSDARDLDSLEAALGHRFGERVQLERALSHRSWANEQKGGPRLDNEKLEFLGDAVLALVVGQLLMERHPELGEGELSVARARVVSEVGLAQAAADLGLGAYLRLGKGEEKSGGRSKASLLADALEAVVAAVFLDGGLDAARRVATRLFDRLIAEVGKAGGGDADAKTRLQELAQARLKSVPDYRLLGESGPDHDKRFEVAVVLEGREWARASGRSKKAAEQLAAAIAADELAARPDDGD